MKIKINKYFLMICFLSLFIANKSSFAAYHEANLGESELSTTTTSTATSSFEDFLLFPKESDGSLGKEISDISDSISEFNLNDFLDFSKAYFWIFIVALFLILMILARLFSKIYKMKEAVKEHESKIRMKNIEDNSDDKEKLLEENMKDSSDELDDQRNDIIEEENDIIDEGDNEKYSKSDVVLSDSKNKNKEDEVIDDEDEILYN